MSNGMECRTNHPLGNSGYQPKGSAFRPIDGTSSSRTLQSMQGRTRVGHGWAGRHENSDGLKPPITSQDHDLAIAIAKRGRHEKTPPVFRSPFAEAGEAYVVSPGGGWFQTVRTHVAG